MRPIKMVDLQGQYQQIRREVDEAIQQVLLETDFIQGAQVRDFEKDLSDYHGGAYIVSCGNGTDALQIAMMALDLKPGDEVIVPVFTYVATAEVIALLGLTPVFADVREDFFTLDVEDTARKLTRKTRAIVPVHLFGQCADMQGLMDLVSGHQLHVIEDNAQSLGAVCRMASGEMMAGTIGTLGTISFFPSKNLGACGDGGAMVTLDADLAEKARTIANHGQRKKYHHDVVGVNSRLDTLQAAILQVKLRHLSEFNQRRLAVAAYYDRHLKGASGISIPARPPYSTHVFHQYTLRVSGGRRDRLQHYLKERGIPTAIYYPIALHLQTAYRKAGFDRGSFPVAEMLTTEVLSLPIHTEMDEEQLSYICSAIKNFT